MNLVTSDRERGCGIRDQGGLYLCSGFGPHGKPIEYFVQDPVILWDGPVSFRTPIIFKKLNGISDVVMWVGKEHYPFVPDFIEEARVMGISKRIPVGPINYNALTPYQSRLILVHPYAIHNKKYILEEVDLGVKPNILRPDLDSVHSCKHSRSSQLHTVSGKHTKECTFSLWDLSSTEKAPKRKITQTEYLNSVEIETPSTKYSAMLPMTTEGEFDYQPGIFAMFPITHFEFVNEKGGITDGAVKALGKNKNQTAVTPT